jgi:hypothetical protein
MKIILISFIELSSTQEITHLLGASDFGGGCFWFYLRVIILLLVVSLILESQI